MASAAQVVICWSSFKMCVQCCCWRCTCTSGYTYRLLCCINAREELRVYRFRLTDRGMSLMMFVLCNGNLVSHFIRQTCTCEMVTILCMPTEGCLSLQTASLAAHQSQSKHTLDSPAADHL